MSKTLVAGLNKLDVGMTPVYVPPETATLYGAVIDANTGNTLGGVLVEVVETGFSGYTDSSGNYEIANIPLGTYSIRFSLTGYETLVI